MSEHAFTAWAIDQKGEGRSRRLRGRNIVAIQPKFLCIFLKVASEVQMLGRCTPCLLNCLMVFLEGVKESCGLEGKGEEGWVGRERWGLKYVKIKFRCST